MNKKYYCKKCNKEIVYSTMKYGSGLCRSCSCKKRLKDPENHNMFGKHHTKDTKKKISKTKIQLKQSKGKNNPAYKGGVKRFPKCIDCNKRLSRIDAERCKVCWNKLHSIILKELFKDPQNNPSYIDGRTSELYPFEFNKTLKLKIRERDNFECQHCHMTEEGHISIFETVLTVHHIDYNKQNCKEENLIALCNQCNIRVNFNRDYYYALFTYIMENYIYVKNRI